MIRQFIGLLAILISLSFMMTACSDPNAEAPSENDAHPSSWTDIYVDHRAYVSANGFTTCSTKVCHGSSFVDSGLAIPSCGSPLYINKNGETHSCHDGHFSGPAWLLPAAHVTAALANTPQCFSCHDMTISVPNYPACNDCHTTNPNYILGTCSSCHNEPPSTGDHLLHVNGEGFDCSVCHFGFGTNTLGHWYPDQNAPADVVFDVNVTGGTITYSRPTCSGTCHGEGHSDDW